MFTDFEKLPGKARVWVYLADITLTDNEVNAIGEFLKINIQTWAAHREALLGSFKFIQNRFLIISVDEQVHTPSGCSIDASTRWIKEIFSTFNIDFLTRAIVIKKEDSIETLPVFQIRQHIEKGTIASETMVYDQQIVRKDELKNSFLKPANVLFGRYFLEKASNIEL
jgi:hypothetical protein